MADVSGWSLVMTLTSEAARDLVQMEMTVFWLSVEEGEGGVVKEQQEQWTET